MEGGKRGPVPLDLSQKTLAIEPANVDAAADARHEEIGELAEKLLFIANRLRQLENADPSARTSAQPIRAVSNAGGGAYALDRREAEHPWTECNDPNNPTEPRYDAPNPHDGLGIRSQAQATPARNLEAARTAYAIRRSRNRIFGNAELFGEPAWDILLDLYVALGEGKTVSVSSACIGSAAPPTTGLRWLGVLSDLGFILREHDPEDQRRVLVRLSDKGLAAMDRYFNNAAADY